MNHETDKNLTEGLGLLKFNYGFAQNSDNLVQDSPKQARNEINYTRNCIFSACASVYREICLSRHETVRLN